MISEGNTSSNHWYIWRHVSFQGSTPRVKSFIAMFFMTNLRYHSTKSTRRICGGIRWNGNVCRRRIRLQNIFFWYSCSWLMAFQVGISFLHPQKQATKKKKHLCKRTDWNKWVVLHISVWGLDVLFAFPTKPSASMPHRCATCFGPRSKREAVSVQMTSGQKRRKDRHQKGEKKCDSQNEETLLLWKNRGIVMESSCGFILKAKNLGRYRWTDWRWIIHGSFMKNNHPFRNFVLDMEVFHNYFPDSPFSKTFSESTLFKRKIFGDLNFSFFLGGLYYTDPYCILWKNKAVFFFVAQVAI